MPCYDKKLEASREDFYNDLYRTRDVDCVISSGQSVLVFVSISLYSSNIFIVLCCCCFVAIWLCLLDEVLKMIEETDVDITKLPSTSFTDQMLV